MTNKNIRKGVYYLTSNWEFKYAPTEIAARLYKPIKYWEVENFPQFDAALEEAGLIRCKKEHVYAGKIKIVI